MVKYYRLTRGTNSGYALTFFVMEFLNLVIVLGQMFLMDFFVGGEFFTYGFEAIGHHFMEHQERSDPMSVVFPKMTKCFFRKYGVSGSLEIIDGLCVLPLNVVHEKIFLFFFIFLGVITLVTMLHLTYRAACLMSFVRINKILAKVGS